MSRHCNTRYPVPFIFTLSFAACFSPREQAGASGPDDATDDSTGDPVGGADETTAAVTDGGSLEPQPECGDGIVDAQEDCDDHGASVLCNADCTLTVCGDGVVNPLAGEECDDGNAEDRDGGTCSWPTSCAQLHALAAERGDGVYGIDPDGIGPTEAYEVMCDMTSGGGGWSLVLVASDDGTDTFTWNQRTLFSTNTSVVGNLAATNLDFKSAAYHDLMVTDLLFVHQPSGVWADPAFGSFSVERA